MRTLLEQKLFQELEYRGLGGTQGYLKATNRKLSEEVNGVQDKKMPDESIRIAHLTMLLGVITRMGANSFTLKALAATFGSAAVAVMATAEKPSPYYAISAIVPVIMFWLMDAQYLRLERAYRVLYEHVRKGEEIESYSLEATPFMQDTASVFRLALSRSVSWFYVAIFLSLGVVALLIFREA